MKIRTIIVVGSCIFITLLIGFAAQSPAPQQSDFLAFWAASKLFINGSNPYDPVTLLSTQQGVGFVDTEAMMFWNPPILLSIIWFLGLLEFKVAVNIWTIINVVLGLVSVFSTLVIFKLKPNWWFLCWLVFIVCAPFYEIIYLGQSSLIVGSAFCVGWALLVRGQKFLSGAVLAVALVKPQLLCLILPALLLDAVFSRHWHLLIGLIVGFLTLLAIPLLINPQVFTWWWEIQSGAMNLKSATVTTMLRIYLSTPDNVVNWPFFLVPAIGIISFIILVLRQKKFDLLREFSTALLWSIILAPYAWDFDFILLYPVQVYCIFRIVTSDACNAFQRRIVVLSVIAVNLAMLIVGTLWPVRHYLFWYPLAVGLLYLFVVRMAKQDLITEERV